MKQGVTREIIVKTIKEDLKVLIKDIPKLKKVADQLYLKHNIPKSELFELTEDNDFKDVNSTELALIAKYISVELGREAHWIEKYYQSTEIVRMNVYKRVENETPLILEFRPAIKLKDDLYYIYATWDTIAKMYELGKFIWDERVQREGVKKKYNNSIIVVPKINKTNVKEIKEQALQGILMENELAYNAVLGSSSEGQEVYYDEKTFTLIIAGDALGHILDGFHRTKGIHDAWIENPEIQGVMPIRLSNYDIEESARYQVELSKATPVDKSRIQQLDERRLTDKIVDKLKTQGRLQGKIVGNSRINRDLNELVSYKVLSDGFNDAFKDDANPKIIDITKKFQEYLDYLFEIYADKYIDDKNSLLFRNNAFYLHVHLFGFLYKNDIDMSEIENLLNVDYFNTEFVKDNLGLDFSFLTEASMKNSKKGMYIVNEMIRMYKVDVLKEEDLDGEIVL